MLRSLFPTRTLCSYIHNGDEPISWVTGIPHRYFQYLTEYLYNFGSNLKVDSVYHLCITKRWFSFHHNDEIGDYLPLDLFL